MRDAGRSCLGKRYFLELRFHWTFLSTLCPAQSSCKLPFTSSHSFTFLSRMRTIASDVFSISVSVKALATFSLYISWFSHACPLILRPISHLLPFSQTILKCVLFLTQPVLCQPRSSFNWQAGPRREQVALSHPLWLDSTFQKVNVAHFKVWFRQHSQSSYQYSALIWFFLGLKPTENESWS